MQNQKGQAVMLTVIILSTIMITSLATAYIYSINRLRFYSQIKEAYKLVDATEAAAKNIKSAWDQAFAVVQGNPAACSTNPCTPNNLFTDVVLGGVTGTPLINTGVGVCFDNVDANTQYCFTPASFSGDNIELKLRNKFQDRELNRFEKFVARLDGFFNQAPIGTMNHNEIHYFGNVAMVKPGLFNWLLGERKALATGATLVVPPNVAVNCKYESDHHLMPLDPGCAVCDTNNTLSIGNGGANNQQSKCVKFSICPPSWGLACAGPNPPTVVQSFRIPTDNDLF